MSENQINKSLEALVRGYVRFNVNGKRYWLYSSALAERKARSNAGLHVKFIGFSIIKGWRMFYVG